MQDIISEYIGVRNPFHNNFKLGCQVTRKNDYDIRHSLPSYNRLISLNCIS